MLMPTLTRLSVNACAIALLVPVLATAHGQGAAGAVQRLGRATIQQVSPNSGAAGTPAALLPVVQYPVQRVDPSPIGVVTRIICVSPTSVHNPIYVIDGVIQGAKDSVVVDSIAAKQLSDLGPDDIASIEVLKGPTAIERYGPGAHNGAVIITTKAKSRRR
jgi:TonB-dependent SusC/RagA subfamily outer membrane receptor